MHTIPSFPATVDGLEIPEDLKVCVRALARPDGIHELSVLLILIAMLASLRSRRITIMMMGKKRRMVLTLIHLEGYTSENREWLSWAFEGVRLRAGIRPREIEDKRESTLRTLTILLELIEKPKQIEMSKTDPEAIRSVEGNKELFARWFDDYIAERVTTEMPSVEDKNYGFDFSPLVFSGDKTLVEFANVDYRADAWEHLCDGVPFAWCRTVAPTVILRASRQTVRRMWNLQHPRDFHWPLLLPATGGMFRPAEVRYPELAQKWLDLVDAANATWHQPARTLTTSEEGYAILAFLRDEMERTVIYRCTPERLFWVLPHCATIAAWHHLTMGEKGDVIAERSWKFAAILSRYAIHAHCVASRNCGGVRFHPAKELSDRDRLLKRLQADPLMSFRSAVRALPKRQPGYWRKLYDCLVLVEEIASVRNTRYIKQMDEAYREHARANGL